MNKGLRKRKETLRKKIVLHHVLYGYDGLRHKQEPIAVPVFHNEHYIIKLLQTRGKYVSQGFLRCLEYFIWQHKHSAVDLSASSADTQEKEKDDTEKIRA